MFSEFFTSISPTQWAAFAAGLSALATIIMVYFQRRNYIEQVRPHLILIDWIHNKPKDPKDTNLVNSSGQISIGKIKNIGKGVALQVKLFMDSDIKDKSLKFLHFPKYFPIIASNQDITLDSKIYLSWKKIEDTFINLDLKILCSDSYGNSYLTVYHLKIDHSIDMIHDIISPSILTEGVFLRYRDVKITSAISFKFRHSFSRIFDWIMLK